MEFLNASNNAETQLVSSMSDTDTTCTVRDSSIFPKPPFLISINDEIIKVTSVEGNTFGGLERGQENTTPSEHNIGSFVENRFTAGMYNSVTSSVEEVSTKIPEIEKQVDNVDRDVVSLNGNVNALSQDLNEHKADKANPHNTNKTHVGLGNVDNVKQMPISGGILENYSEKLITLSGTNPVINLSEGNNFKHTLSGNTTYTIKNAVSGSAHSFTLVITQTATVRTITFPASVKWQGGKIPDLTTASKTYILTFITVNGGTTWLGMFGGEF